MVLEVIVTTPQEAIDASNAHASRVELISAPSEGGLTPSYALVASVKSLIELPVHVMIRPHAKSFVYDEYEKQLMLEDIRQFKKLNVDGFVIGALTKTNEIDQDFLIEVVRIAGETPLTFHRAIDEVNNVQKEALKLQSFPTVKRLLTSYGKGEIMSHLDELKQLQILLSGSGQAVLAGGGLTIDHLERFLSKTGIKEVHFGRGVRINGRYDQPLDQAKIQKIMKMIDKDQLL